MPTIVEQHHDNFITLQRAFLEGDVALVDCIERSTGEHVAVICATSRKDDKYTVVPFAKFFNGNPYELLMSPMEYEEEKNAESGEEE